MQRATGGGAREDGRLGLLGSGGGYTGDEGFDGMGAERRLLCYL